MTCFLRFFKWIQAFATFFRLMRVSRCTSAMALGKISATFVFQEEAHLQRFCEFLRLQQFWEFNVPIEDIVFFHHLRAFEVRSKEIKLFMAPAPRRLDSSSQNLRFFKIGSTCRHQRRKWFKVCAHVPFFWGERGGFYVPSFAIRSLHVKTVPVLKFSAQIRSSNATLVQIFSAHQNIIVNNSWWSVLKYTHGTVLLLKKNVSLSVFCFPSAVLRMVKGYSIRQLNAIVFFMHRKYEFLLP